MCASEASAGWLLCNRGWRQDGSSRLEWRERVFLVRGGGGGGPLDPRLLWPSGEGLPPFSSRSTTAVGMDAEPLIEMCGDMLAAAGVGLLAGICVEASVSGGDEELGTGMSGKRAAACLNCKACEAAEAVPKGLTVAYRAQCKDLMGVQGKMQLFQQHRMLTVCVGSLTATAASDATLPRTAANGTSKFSV